MEWPPEIGVFSLVALTEPLTEHPFYVVCLCLVSQLPSQIYESVENILQKEYLASNYHVVLP